MDSSLQKLSSCAGDLQSLTLTNPSAIISTVTTLLPCVIENLAGSQEILGNFLKSFRASNLSQIRRKMLQSNCKLLKRCNVLAREL